MDLVLLDVCAMLLVAFIPWIASLTCCYLLTAPAGVDKCNFQSIDVEHIQQYCFLKLTVCRRESNTVSTSKKPMLSF